MTTRPRMSAAIGRLQIRRTTRKRRGSAVTHVKAVEIPFEARERESATPRADDTLPRYYPFAPFVDDDGED